VEGEDLDRRRRTGQDLLAGLVLAGIGLWVLVASLRMPFYSGSGWVGSPGLTPGVVGAVLIVLALVLASRGLRHSVAFGSWRPGVAGWRAAGVVAIVTGYVAVIPWIGYVPATFLMLVVFQSAFARAWSLRFLLLWVLGLSAGLTGALWWLFAKIFLIPMP
jgi:hypothetical protein